MRNVTWILLTFAGCVQSTAAPTIDAPPQGRVRVAPESDPSCSKPHEVESIEIAAGETQRLRDGDLAITYVSVEHDTYEGGRTDQLVHLRFQGIIKGRQLSSSALTWLPSVFEPPRFVHLEVGHCVRLRSATRERVALEVFRPIDQGG